MSSAAVSVKAGSWDEPAEYPGLAHFLEHMLFAGSKQYPSAGYFDSLVATAGGYSNAFTENTETNFYFSGNSKSLNKILEVFAHFFVDPLLSAESTSKEVNAVNSEYEIDVSDDDWKLQHLVSLMSEKSHPQSRFTIGNT